MWKQSHAIVLEVYRTTQAYPSEERFGLVSQMRRAAVSVPANIAEGFKRRTLKDKSHFYNIAQGSMEELRYYFIVCRDLHYTIDYQCLDEKADHVARMLTSLIHSLER